MLTDVTVMPIDLNCDLGEGAGSDADVIPLITTANVACGFHAGDPATAFATIAVAHKAGVRVGAHPGFPDRANFGRTEMRRSEQEVYEDCVYQIGAVAGIAKSFGLALSHVKAHGALYNMACRDDHYARAIVAATKLFGLPLMGIPGTRIETACAGRCEFVAEGFADRRYRTDGTLVPRTDANPFVEEPAEAVRQAAWLVRERGVRTMCVHGDNPRALDFVRALRAGLTSLGLTIQSFA
jgi:5-oxoprolinase (ATP-hydrolysing) subunit A